MKHKKEKAESRDSREIVFVILHPPVVKLDSRDNRQSVGLALLLLYMIVCFDEDHSCICVIYDTVL